MIIRIENLTKLYGEFRALDDVSASVEAGSIGLLGPNGAGKSTLIKVLLGLVKRSSGTAQVLGMDTVDDALQIRSKVGYMPEDDTYLVGLKGVEMVARLGECAGIPARTALRRAHEMLDYVHLGESRYRMLHEYSQGMKQRVKLATALIHSPQLVFLDEPTSGLDPEGREKMLDLVRDLARNKGVSVVISTHILHDVEACCDSVLMLDRGVIKVHDTLANLQAPVSNKAEARLEGDVDGFIAATTSRGLRAQRSARDEEIIEVTGEGDIPRTILESAQASGVMLRGVSPAKTSLEKIFLDALRGGQNADS